MTPFRTSQEGRLQGHVCRFRLSNRNVFLKLPRDFGVPYDDRVSEKRFIGYRQSSSISWLDRFFISNGDCTAMLRSAQLRNRQFTTRVGNAPAVALYVLECYSKLISDTGVLKSRME